MRIVVTRNSNSPVLHAAFVPIGKKGKWQKLYLHYNLPASSFCFFLLLQFSLLLIYHFLSPRQPFSTVSLMSMVFSLVFVLNLAFLLPWYLHVSSSSMLASDSSYLRPRRASLFSFAKLSRMYTFLCTYAHSLINSLAPVNSLAQCPWNLFLHSLPCSTDPIQLLLSR